MIFAEVIFKKPWPLMELRKKDMLKIKTSAVGTLVFIFVTTLLLSMASSLGESPKGNIAVSEEFNHGLQFILKTDKATYRSEEPIVIALTLTNKGPRPIKFTFPSAQKYDFIARKNKDEIWRWSQDKMFTMMLTELVLQSNQSLAYEEIWTQEDNEGEYILPGTYEILGILMTYPEAVSQPLAVEIISDPDL